ncbi:hypothetical protein Taro_026349 [Colocasia esculenta]|uniref:Chitinase n=1 Tax=Colocasia esculenta TaxID=4460 RepID=A0A843VB57_COLES|nr:hypothetical protein [Colocasia esculenta]
MSLSELLCPLVFLQILPTLVPLTQVTQDFKLFRTYKGAAFLDNRTDSIRHVKPCSDVPIDPRVCFHFILSFVIDYNSSGSNNSSSYTTPTHGRFDVFWDSKYGWLVDYVNFQFYAYGNGTTVPQFLRYFETQSDKYRGATLLVSYISDGSRGGLPPGHGFFSACNRLKLQGNLHGIFVWSADDSKANGFKSRSLSSMPYPV